MKLKNSESEQLSVHSDAINNHEKDEENTNTKDDGSMQQILLDFLVFLAFQNKEKNRKKQKEFRRK